MSRCELGLLVVVVSGCATTAPPFVVQELDGPIPEVRGRECIGAVAPSTSRALLVFSTPGCEPCQRLLRVIDETEVSDEIALHHIVVGERSCNAARLESRTSKPMSVSVMDDGDSRAWGFRVSPTLVYVEDGRACRMAVGVLDSEALEQLTRGASSR